MAWQIEGADILTPQGLDALEGAAVVRSALIAENDFQCGYCPASRIDAAPDALQ